MAPDEASHLMTGDLDSEVNVTVERDIKRLGTVVRSEIITVTLARDQVYVICYCV